MARVVWLGLAGLVLGLAILIWFVLRPAPTTLPTTAQELTVAGASILGVTQVGEQVLWLEGGEVHGLNLSSDKPQVLTTLPFTPQAVRFAPDEQQALVQDLVGGGQWHHADLGSGTTTPLHSSIRQPTWSADSDQILYSFTGTTPSKLSVAEPDGTDWQNLIDLPRGFGQLVWPGEGLYAVGLDLLATPGRYARLLISSRRVETALETERSDANLRSNPTGAHVLLDSGTDTQPAVSVINLATGSVSRFLEGASVARTVWQDETTIVAFQNPNDGSPRLVRRSLGSERAEIIVDWPIDETFPDELIAVTQDHLIFTSGGQLKRRRLP